MSFASSRFFPSLLLCATLIACGDDDAFPDSGLRDAAGFEDARPDAPTEDAADLPDANDDSGFVDVGIDSGELDAAADAAEDTAPDAIEDFCQPFTREGCFEGRWCEPDESTRGGACIDIGVSRQGESCEESSDCFEGHLCIGGKCELACDSGASVGTPRNPCVTPDRCGNLRPDDGGEPLALGICVPGCDFDAGQECRDETLTCQPNEIISADDDLCLPDIENLPPQGDCALAGIAHGQLCGPGRICLDREDFREGNLCYTVCRGVVGVEENDDCPDGELCHQFALGGLGVCF